MRFKALVLLWLLPGINYSQEYFQQWVDYSIDVTLDDHDHRLSGELNMVYHNNSSDTLNELYIHLWPNAYSSRNTELAKQLRQRGDFDFEFSEEQERGGFQSIDFKLEGEHVPFSYYQDKIDIALIPLPFALSPGDSLRLEIPFVLKIPSSRFSRLGHIGDSYQITQWYPKPAVYDKDGWHPMSYLNQGEFYSEFGSYHVSITLPENYVVGATGELQEESEKEFLRQRAELSGQQLWKGNDNSFPASSTEMKTIHYHQDSIHDFAWFADKRFHVIHERFSLDSGKEVDGWILHTNRHAKTWSESMEYLIDGTKHYSRAVGDYPYSHVTVVDGTLAAGGGMEYPMITVINGTSDAMRLEQVIVHEIGHNWFYGILASNERRDPWMDEGINSYYEARYFREKYPDRKGTLLELLGGSGKGLSEMVYRMMSCRHQDQSLDLTSDEYSSLNYGAMVYLKGALVMEHLESILGREDFDEAMQSYYRQWGFKHPDEDGLQNSLETSTGQDLDWFFDHLIETASKIDHSLHQYDKVDNSILVRSHTSYDGPVEVGFFKDSTLVDTRIGSGNEFRLFSEVEFTKAEIDPYGPSLQSINRNDIIRTKGLLKTWQRPAVKALIGSGLADEATLYFSPVIGWNENDNWMLGAYLSNMEVIPKRTEWTLIPLFSTSASDLVGSADIRHSIYPSETAPDRLEVGLNAKRFSLEDIDDLDFSYLKITPSFRFVLDDPSKRKGKHEIYYQLHYIMTSQEEEQLIADEELIFNELGYNYSQKRGLTEHGGGVMLEFHDSYQKITAEYTIEQVFDKLDNKWSIRAYGGKMWYQEFIPLGAQLALSGQGPAVRADGTYDDYRYDHLLLGRGESGGHVSQQFILNRGGFVHRSFNGFTDDWLASVNAEIDLPIPGPLSVFGNYGVFSTSKGSSSLYQAGLRLTIIDRFFDISFPIPALSSTEIQESYDANGVNYGETIRFQLRLDEIRIRKLIDNLSI